MPYSGDRIVTGVETAELCNSRGTWRETDQDRIWVLASRGGDLLAFNRLVLKWETRVYNLSLRMLGNREEAADITQEIFLSVFKNIRKFRGDSKFSTWLYRVAVNRCISRLRKLPSMTISIETEDFEGAQDGVSVSVPGRQEEAVLQMEQRRRILQSVSALNPEQRAVVELKLFQEETFESISDTLEVPLSTVKSRFYAAMEVLKGRLRYLVEEIDE